MVKLHRFVFILYTIFIIFYVSYLFTVSNITETFKRDVLLENEHSMPNITSNQSVDIMGKASIADYFWHHIFKGQVKTLNNTLMKLGLLHVDGTKFVYRTGPGYIQTSLSQNTEYLVLILNGRTKGNVKKAKEWLDYLPRLPKLRKAGIVLLGNEQCENEWILNYMRSRGGVVDVLFLIYDSPLVDNFEIFQWPLGVAVYRGFPKVEPPSVITTEHRGYKCNFIGTVYQNTSRETVVDILNIIKEKHKCFLSTRSEWVPNETPNDLTTYMSVLMNSDLTLNPVGKNTECYRIYEAMSYGSIPVIEDIMTPGICSSPLRLLKAHNAPVFYINNWHDLERVLDAEQNFSFHEIIQRRQAVLRCFKKVL